MNNSDLFMPQDLARSVLDSVKVNYTGAYNPNKFWDEFGRHYLKTFSLTKDQKGEDIQLNIIPLIARIRDFNPKSVLEVGCGFGRCLSFVDSNVSSVERLEGIELSPTMIEQSEKYFKWAFPNRKTKIKIIEGNAASLPYKDNEFDLIYSHVCLTHIPCEAIPSVTKEISRVAKKTIIHFERFKYPYEHSLQHRWSHMLAPYYMDLGWYMHENSIVHEKHNTNSLVLINKKVR